MECAISSYREPRDWHDKYNATVQVGLGTGSQDQRLEVLGRVLAVQEKLIATGGMGIVIHKIYILRNVENAGYKDASQFFNNPATRPPQQPKQKRPDPTMQLAQAELQRQQAKDQAELQLKARKQKADEEIQEKKPINQN